jgi:hypothetical protein
MGTVWERLIPKVVFGFNSLLSPALARTNLHLVTAFVLLCLDSALKTAGVMSSSVSYCRRHGWPMLMPTGAQIRGPHRNVRQRSQFAERFLGGRELG